MSKTNTILMTVLLLLIAAAAWGVQGILPRDSNGNIIQSYNYVKADSIVITNDEWRYTSVNIPENAVGVTINCDNEIFFSENGTNSGFRTYCPFTIQFGDMPDILEKKFYIRPNNPGKTIIYLLWLCL